MDAYGCSDRMPVVSCVAEGGIAHDLVTASNGRRGLESGNSPARDVIGGYGAMVKQDRQGEPLR